VAELAALAGGRADLLAEVAGIFEGTSEGELDEPLARSAATLNVPQLDIIALTGQRLRRFRGTRTYYRDRPEMASADPMLAAGSPVTPAIPAFAWLLAAFPFRPGWER
jgi:hypothetical protein